MQDWSKSNESISLTCESKYFNISFSEKNILIKKNVNKFTQQFVE